MRSRDPIHMQHRKVKQINNCLGFKVRARVDFKWPQWAKMYGKYSTIGWWWWYLTTISIMCKSNSGWAGRWGQLLQCIVTITRKNQAVLRLTVHLLKETRQTSWEQALQTQQLKKRPGSSLKQCGHLFRWEEKKEILELRMTVEEHAASRHCYRILGIISKMRRFNLGS